MAQPGRIEFSPPRSPNRTRARSRFRHDDPIGTWAMEVLHNVTDIGDYYNGVSHPGRFDEYGGRGRHTPICLYQDGGRLAQRCGGSRARWRPADLRTTRHRSAASCAGWTGISSESSLRHERPLPAYRSTTWDRPLGSGLFRIAGPAQRRSGRLRLRPGGRSLAAVGSEWAVATLGIALADRTTCGPVADACRRQRGCSGRYRDGRRVRRGVYSHNVVVPWVIELRAQAAAARVRAAGLNPVFTGNSGSTAWVSRQSPRPGATATPGSTVTLQTRTSPIP